jgi:hypothetical protein
LFLRLQHAVHRRGVTDQRHRVAQANNLIRRGRRQFVNPSTS